MPLQVSTGTVIGDNVRPLLNVTALDGYSDVVILPYFKMAYDELRMECEDNNIPFTNITSKVITITAGVIDVGGPTGPALPPGLVEIYEIYERTSGTDNDFMLMRRRNFLPKTSQLTQFLEIWTWQNQVINFLGANSAVDIKIDYVADTLVNIVDSNTLIPLFNSRLYLGYRTAALCARFIGENPDRADQLDGMASNALEMLENIGVKNQQGNPIRRKPFMSAYRQRGWAGYR